MLQCIDEGNSCPNKLYIPYVSHPAYVPYKPYVPKL
jgi:hypothetical protein